MSRTGVLHQARRSRAGNGTSGTRRRTEPFRIYARASALSGIVFAGLFLVALVLVRQAPGLAASDRVYTEFYTAGTGNVLVTVGMHIVPFAGIACLWHIGSTRSLIESLPGPTTGLPHWLQLASGVLFVCMLFAGTAAVGAVALLTVFSSTPPPSPEVARTFTGAGYGLVFVFGVRAAGMYMITTTTLARQRDLLSRPMAVVTYLAAAFLLVTTTFHPVTLLVFPGWVLVLSVLVLVRTPRPRTTAPGPDPLRPSMAHPSAPDQRTAHEHDDRP
jgi:hypothetical protein